MTYDEQIMRLVSGYVHANDNNKKLHLADKAHKTRLLYLAPTAIMTVFIILSPINVAQGQTIKDQAKKVAFCENKNITKIHNELKERYNYRSYTKISYLKYTLVTIDLKTRC